MVVTDWAELTLNAMRAQNALDAWRVSRTDDNASLFVYHAMRLAREILNLLTAYGDTVVVPGSTDHKYSAAGDDILYEIVRQFVGEEGKLPTTGEANAGNASSFAEMMADLETLLPMLQGARRSSRVATLDT